MELKHHQQRIVDENPRMKLLAWGTGAGKTLASISLANKNCRSVFVICPKALKENWNRQIKQHGNSHVVWRVYSKEEFKKLWDKLVPVDGIIYDEAHYIAGVTSQMTKTFIKYCKQNNVKYKWLLSATPYLSTPWNVYVLANHLGERINYIDFKRDFFTEVRMGMRTIPVPKKDKKTEQKLLGIIHKIGSVVKLEDCVDLPEQSYEVEYFKMTGAQEKAIDDIEETTHITKWTKTHQICGGSLKSDGYTEDEDFDCDKFDRAIGIAESNDKLIIVCRYLNEIKRFKEKLGKDAYVFSGETENRQELLDEIRKKDSYVLLVSASCSEGWELPECPVMVFYSYSFSLKDYIQMCGRIRRLNHPKKNLYLSLVVEDSIDEDVYKTIMKKEDFHLRMYDI